MRKILVNLGKLIEDVTIGYGENGVGKSGILFLHEPKVPEELKAFIDSQQETNQEKQHATE